MIIALRSFRSDGEQKEKAQIKRCEERSNSRPCWKIAMTTFTLRWCISSRISKYLSVREMKAAAVVSFIWWCQSAQVTLRPPAYSRSGSLPLACLLVCLSSPALAHCIATPAPLPIMTFFCVWGPLEGHLWDDLCINIFYWQEERVNQWQPLASCTGDRDGEPSGEHWRSCCKSNTFFSPNKDKQRKGFLGVSMLL